MKNYYLLIIILFSSFCTTAQPTINSTDLLPSIGEQFTTQITTYTNPGASGNGVTWDFSSLTSSGSNTFSYSNPSSTPFVANFPTATLCIANAGSYTYSSSSSTSLNDIGWASSTSGYFCNYSNSKQLLSFPISFNASVSDTYYGDYYASTTHIENSGTVQLTYDGFGTLVLPTGTYTNVVRFIKVDNATNTSTSGGSTYSSTQNQTEYAWYKPGIHQALLSFVTTTATSSGATTTYKYASYYDPNATGINKATAENTTIVYPNPANEHVTIHFADNNKVKTIEVVDIIGKKVMTQEIAPATSSIQLSLPHLQAGMYYVHFKDVTNTLIQSKKFEKMDN